MMLNVDQLISSHHVTKTGRGGESIKGGKNFSYKRNINSYFGFFVA